MRTPLTSLELFFGLLARRFDSLPPREVPTAGVAGRPHDRDRDPRRGAEVLQMALVYSQASVRRLARLADDLVDDARILHGHLSLRMEPCDLGPIVCMAVEEQCAAEPDRTILLELPGGGQPVPVLADAERIAQVVTNYLTNALKYSTQERPVRVRLEVVKVMEGAGGSDGATSNVARVSVQDEGIGVPFAAQPHVWERFAVVAGNTVQSGSGISLGLGLHICKMIIEQHHGQVGLNSAPGQGSTFWFMLPLALPAASSPGGV